MSDLISRQAAIDAIENTDCEISADAWDELTDSIMQLPSVEPRKKGRWIEKEVFDNSSIDEWQSAQCSACGLYHTTPYLYYFDNYNFCPNCGARMEVTE